MLSRLDSDSPAIPDAAEHHEGNDRRDGRRDLRLQVEGVASVPATSQSWSLGRLYWTGRGFHVCASIGTSLSSARSGWSAGVSGIALAGAVPVRLRGRR
jgi:hypothetical protein